MLLRTAGSDHTPTPEPTTEGARPDRAQARLDAAALFVDAVNQIATRLSSSSFGKMDESRAFWRRTMRRVLAAILAGSMFVVGAAACDDNKQDGQGIDEDDTRVGPGDGNDEVGPGR